MPAPNSFSPDHESGKLMPSIPAEAFPFCHKVIAQYPVTIKLSKSRKTKFGDFRMNGTVNGISELPVITVNKDLNRYAFLITFLHEMAHRIAFHKYGKKIRAHGKEWKEEFKNVMRPVYRKSIFPEDILRILGKHMANPRASTASDADLYKVLRTYDPSGEGVSDTLYLSTLKEGSVFKSGKKTFRLLQRRRTRALCEDMHSRRKYLLPLIAEISLVGKV